MKMPDGKKRPSSPFDAALIAIKEGKINEARERLGISAEAVPDDDLVQAMISVDKGIELSSLGRQPDAVKYFQQAIPVVGMCTDTQARSYFDLITRIALGITSLLQGDTVMASQVLGGCADMIERADFFLPTLKILTLQTRAWCEIAQAKTKMNIGNMKDAESHLGKADDFYTQALELTDSADPHKYQNLIGVYGNRVETAISFAFIDLQALDLESAAKRLNAVAGDAVKLQEVVEKIETGPIRNVALASTKVYAAMNEIHYLATRILHDRSPLDKENLKRFKQAAQLLFDAEELAQRSGERGELYLFTIRQLEKILRNLLEIGRLRKGDFGRYGGIVFLLVFFLVMVFLRLTITPSGSDWKWYLDRALFISLVAAFGYGATKFLSLKAVKERYSEVWRLFGEKKR